MNPSLVELAKGTNLVDLREYLRVAGWAPIEHRNPRLEVFRLLDQSSALELVLPRTSDVIDFAFRIAETLQTLSLLTKQAPATILTQINEISEDVLRARVLTPELGRSSIPLDIAVSVIGGLKKLLTYSAVGEASPLPFFSRPTKKAVAHADHCRFGHTFSGSFGFTIESPLAPAIQDPLLAEVAAPPFERRVMERLYRGLSQLKEASDTHELAPVVTNYVTGLSANMCDALLDITGVGLNREVIFAVDWSPKVLGDLALREQPKEVSIGPQAVEYLQAASKQLRRMEDSRSITIEGRVVLLKSDSQPWEDEPDDPHTVVIAWLDTDGKVVKTRVVLAPADYITACTAHMQGSTVSVAGTLERRGKYTRLLNPEQFGSGRQSTLPT